MMNNQQTFYQYAIGDYGINGLEGERQYNKTMAMVDNVLKQALTQEEAVQFLTRKLKKYMWDLNRQRRRRHYSQTMLGLAAHDLTDSLTTNDCHMVAIRLLTDNPDYVKLGESTMYHVIYEVLGKDANAFNDPIAEFDSNDLDGAIDQATEFVNELLFNLLYDDINIIDSDDVELLANNYDIHVTISDDKRLYTIMYGSSLWSHKLPDCVAIISVEKNEVE